MSETPYQRGDIVLLLAYGGEKSERRVWQKKMSSMMLLRTVRRT